MVHQPSKAIVASGGTGSGAGVGDGDGDGDGAGVSGGGVAVGSWCWWSFTKSLLSRSLRWRTRAQYHEQNALL